MKRLLGLVLCILFGAAVITMPVHAEEEKETSGTCGEDLTWTFEDGTLTISGEGEMDAYDYFSAPTPWADLLSEIITIVIEDGVTSISEDAFYRADQLTDVTIPDSVLTIGESAFSRCDKLAEITIPDGVVTVGDSAFYSCRSLASVSVGKSVENLGQETFSDCNVISDIWVDPENEYYTSEDGVLFDKEMTTLIRYVVGKPVTDYKIPKGVETIEENAFYGGRILKNLMIPSSVNSIGMNALAFMTALESIQVDAKNKAYTSDDGVLYDKEMTCLIAYPAMKDDYSYVIPDSVKIIEERAFDFCDDLVELTIPEGLESIGRSAFLSCSRIRRIELPDSVTDLGPMAFMFCDDLSEIRLSNSLSEIKYCTFEYCGSLESITIPASVTTIAWGVFERCDSLKDVYFEGPAPDISSDSFENITVTVYYPADDDSWDDVADKDYGGTLTWVTYDPTADVSEPDDTETDVNEPDDAEDAPRWIGWTLIQTIREYFEEKPEMPEAAGTGEDEPEIEDEVSPTAGDEPETEDESEAIGDEPETEDEPEPTAEDLPDVTTVYDAYATYLQENEDAMDGEFEVSYSAAPMSIGPNLSFYDVTGDQIPEMLAVCPSREADMADRMSLYIYTWQDGQVQEIPREDGESAIPVFWDQTFAHQLTDSICFESKGDIYVLSILVEVEGGYAKIESILKLTYDEEENIFIPEEVLKASEINGDKSWTVLGEEREADGYDQVRQRILDGADPVILYPGTTSAMFYGHAGEELGIAPGTFYGLDYQDALAYLAY